VRIHREFPIAAVSRLSRKEHRLGRIILDHFTNYEIKVIFNFLALLIIGGCGLIIGNALLIPLDPEKYIDRTGDRAILAIWLGVLLLLNIFLGASLLLPLSPGVAVCVVSTILVLSLRSRPNRAFINQLLHLQRPNFVAAFGLMIFVSISGIQIVHWYDSGLYHIQVIKWLSEFGLVPGLALLHSRFGFVSSWFTLAAPFNHGVLAGRVASLPGGFCMLMLLSGWTLAFLRFMQRRARGQDWFLLTASALAIPLITLRWIAPSPSPDLPVMVLVIFVGWTFFGLSDTWQKNPPQEENTISPWIVPLLLSAGAVTIKLSALPLLAVSFVFYIFGRRSHLQVKKFIVAVVATLAILTPLIVAGIITSGCALYPASLFCTDLPWSLGSSQALTESTIIREWARWNSPTPEGAAPLGWIGPWLQADQVFSFMILLTCISAVLVIITSQNKFRLRNGYIIAIGILGTAFMFYKAPTWRFGLGYLFIIPALLMAVLRERCVFRLQGSPGNLRRAVTSSFIGMLILFIIPSSIIAEYSHKQIEIATPETRTGRGMNARFSFLLPPRTWNMEYDRDERTGEIMTSPVILIKERTGDIDYFRSAHGEMCWDAPLPCSPGKLTDIHLRNPSLGIAGGFMRTQQLKGTINE
jgi:hypothetical protein